MTLGRTQDVWVRIRPHASRLILVMLGIALGGLLFGSTSEPNLPLDRKPAHRAKTLWACSMHPQIRQGEPGQCPLCGMDLVPIGGGEGGSDESEREVSLSKRAQALAKLRTTEVRRRGNASAKVRLLGRIEPDETTQKRVTAWIGGRIDRLHVNVTGARVRAGQIIATLYSPEMYAAHQDLIVALRQMARLDGQRPSIREAARATLTAARKRLQLLGVPKGDLVRMEAADAPTRAVPIRTPFAGTIIERVAAEGAYVATGATLYRVANLNRLWVQLDAYESDLPYLSVNQPVVISVKAVPGRTYEGSISFIDPTLDAVRRTARVRVELDNRDGRLRPGMFAEAVVSAPPVETRAPLVIPSTAPLFTGRRSLVYVEKRSRTGPIYEARAVRLGPRLGDVYPVVVGVSEGERVVTRGAFTLDADLQIHGGASMMTQPDDHASGASDEIITLSEPVRPREQPRPKGAASARGHRH